MQQKMTTLQPDLVNRDPNYMNNHVQIMFDDVLAEPEGAHSANCVWKNSYKCYSCSRNCCYKALTFIFGLPLALYWGCVFACASFYTIWCTTPSIRLTHIVLYSVKKLLYICVGTYLGPFVETCGLFFSRIHVTNSTGEPPRPLGELPGNPPVRASHVRHFK